jgi:hypothetical protein
LLDVDKVIGDFFGQVEAGAIEIYNEFSLQHELGLFIRSAVTSHYRVQFERPVGFFKLRGSTFIKKEIDISVVSADASERIAIELKFPRSGQHPEQMFKFCEDLSFVEQIVAAGFTAGYFVAAVDDSLFYSGSAIGIYAYFRAAVPLHGLIQKPTGKRDATVNICGTYTVQWQSAGTVTYACIRALP